MIKAVLIRGGELAFVAFGVSVLTFLMIHLVPGDAAQIMLGAADATPERIAALRQQLGLDRPLVVQYALWIGRALHGDLGASIWTGTPVIEEIAGRVGITLELTLLGITTAIIIAIPAGCLMATLRLGTQPPTASLGRMLAESRNFLNFSPWPAIFSGAAILLAALGFNLLGDGLQDRLDPRLRSRQ